MLNYDLKTGYSCNNKCVHCVIEDSRDKLCAENKKPDLTTQECFDLIEQAVKCGADNIILTGGEVTIRPDFDKLINKILEYKLDITIQTNARAFCRQRIIDIIANISNIQFITALHGSTAKTHDNITQVTGSFDETCEGIKNLRSLNKLVIIKVVISKINLEELNEIILLALKLGVKYLCFAFPHGQGAARKNFEKLMPRYKDLKTKLKEIIYTAKEHEIKIEFEAVPFCVIPYAMHLVGELKYFKSNTLCSQVHEKVFDWDKVRKDIKIKPELCGRCDMNLFCEGVWREYYEAYALNISDDLEPLKIPEALKIKIMQKLK
ncbi:MAG: radical SAM protein [Synergistaceae bacterium]|nr:radical SAM protein [Synergistaceae bacterium]